MNQVDFLRALWGPEPPGLIQIWRLNGRASFYLKSPVGAAGYQGADLYTGVATAAKNHGRGRRCPADQVAAIPGVWADIDVNGGPDNKHGAAPTIEAAIDVANAVLPPTILVHSGYGVQAWWLLDEPWRFRDAGEQQTAATIAAQWQLLLRRHAQAAGFGLDHTHDLARLLRLPGTLNGKGGRQVPVTVLKHQPLARIPLNELRAIAATAGPVDRQLSTSDLVTGGAPVDVEIRAAGVDAALFNALLTNSPEFADAWHHRRGGKAWSNHEYDLSVCSLAAAADWTDQQLADLIVAHRARWDEGGAKAQRLDYVQRTISRARHTGERGSALSKLRALAHTTTPEAA